LRRWGKTSSAAWRSVFLGGAALGALTSPASAIDFSQEQTTYASLLAAFTLGTGLALSLVKTVRTVRDHHVLQAKLAETERYLNEADAALRAEPHLLLTWRENSEMPDRVTGSMRGAVTVPENVADLMRMAVWLEPDSVEILKAGMKSLTAEGRGFNIGIRTIAGELVEADGRAAGGIATLRLRPLSGERRQVSELTYDAHKLAKQVERLSAVLDGAPFPIWISGKDGDLQWANQAYVAATEMPDIDQVLKSDVQLLRPEAVDTSMAEPTRGLSGRAHAVVHGSMRMFNVYRTEQNDSQAGFAIDATALEEAEKELERYIKAHASTLNKLDTAIAIFGPDQKLRFHNNAYAALWKFDERWLATQPSDGEILEILRANRSLPEQANYREWRDRLLSIYTTLEPQEGYWYLPDGRSLRIYAEQHPFGGVTYLYENLTKELQLESRYNELFGVQRETLDNLAEAVSLFGPDGRLKLFNPAFARFWALEDQFLGDQPHIDMLAQTPTLGTEARAVWQDIRYSITAIDSSRKMSEGRMTHGDHILRYRAVPLPDGDSLLTFADVSDAARAEQALRDRAEALEAADRLKNSFLANVSYEIRTPLTSIVGFAETLEYGLAGPLTQKQKDYVQHIRQSSDDLKAIIDGIIDLSAIDAGAMELRLQQVDVAQAMELVAERSSLLLQRRQLSVSIEVGSGISTITADPQRIDQIVGHLLSNAIGFSPTGSTIQMGARRMRDMVQIWVADTGQGMDPEFQKKAFERFQSKPLPGSHRGPGLGLALVKSFTELHGGQVSLVSKLDQGTTVVCSLPIAGPRRAASLAYSSTAA
jgi:signal transduction histidine kinase